MYSTHCIVNTTKKIDLGEELFECSYCNKRLNNGWRPYCAQQNSQWREIIQMSHNLWFMYCPCCSNILYVYDYQVDWASHSDGHVS